MCIWIKKMPLPKCITSINTTCSEWWMGLKHVLLKIRRSSRSGEKSLQLFWAALIPYRKEVCIFLKQSPSGVPLVTCCRWQEPIGHCCNLLGTAVICRQCWLRLWACSLFELWKAGLALKTSSRAGWCKEICAVFLGNWRLPFAVSAKHLSR